MDEIIIEYQDANNLATDELIKHKIELLKLKNKFKRSVSKKDRSSLSIKINAIYSKISTLENWVLSIGGGNEK